MKLIIDIPDYSLNDIQNGSIACSQVLNAVKNGVPYEERPQGEWIKWDFKTFGAMGDWEYKCSNCEKVYGGEYNFCPNCGSDMRGKTYENN